MEARQESAEFLQRLQEFTERPTDRYILGRLAPDGEVIEPDEQDEKADGAGGDRGKDDQDRNAPNMVSLAPPFLGCTIEGSRRRRPST